MDSLNAFVEFLVADMEATGGDSATDFCTGLLAKAKAKISAGNGQVAFLLSGALNGKTFTSAKEMSCVDMATACRRALDIYTNRAGSGPITFIDFSGTGSSSNPPSPWYSL